ncbi:hypothetical protein ACWD2L_00445 [Streptomyces sp. NPDC002754]
MTFPAIDSPIGTLLATVTACVCAKLRDVGRPACDCCLKHSSSVLEMDGCTCDCDDDDEAAGRVTGRVVTIGPASSSLDTTGNCQTAMVQVTLQVGVFRCIEIPDATDEPDCDVATAEALGFLLDEQAMRAAVSCCPDLKRIPGKWQLTPGQWEPHGPSGGCAGGVITVDAYGLITFPKTPTEATP